MNDYYSNSVVASAKYYGFFVDKSLAVKDWKAVQKDLLFYGVESERFIIHSSKTQPPKTVAKGKFEGVLTGMRRRYQEKCGNSGEADFFFQETCPECRGTKLKEESRQVKVAEKSNSDVSYIPLDVLRENQRTLKRTTSQYLYPSFMNWLKKSNGSSVSVLATCL
ncbi:hypothetical protein [Planococcus antarcticus]|nr:hypothetical protein [Planococcus antarcticus]